MAKLWHSHGFIVSVKEVDRNRNRIRVRLEAGANPTRLSGRDGWSVIEEHLSTLRESLRSMRV